MLGLHGAHECSKSSTSWRGLEGAHLCLCRHSYVSPQCHPPEPVTMQTAGELRGNAGRTIGLDSGDLEYGDKEENSIQLPDLRSVRL